MSTLRGSGNNIPLAGAHHPRVPARAEAALRGPVRLRGGMGQDRARRGPDPLPPPGSQGASNLRRKMSVMVQTSAQVTLHYF